MSTTNEVKVPFFKKGKSRPTTSRKRSASPPPRVLAPIPSSSKSEVVLPSRKATGNLLSAGTKRTAAQRREDEMDDPDFVERDGPAVKWTAAGSHTNAALEILAGDEAAELLAKRQKKEKADRGEEEEEIPDDGLYRGQNAYRSHLKKSQEVPKAMRVGPQRGTSTIRTVTIVDYQPDVCKDYKETGYCGFGDTCKFLHDRGTYLAGWQLDKLAETPRKQVEDVSDSDSDNEDIPFACLICRKPYTDPVATRCGHYYCLACAIKRYAKTPKCLACGAPTGGIFNRADKIINKLNKKRAEKDDDHVEDDSPGVEIEGLVDNGSRDSDSGDDDND
ncbi:uncharacterized protein BJ212DRAFT_1282996 [Suillus subaureus]|uniref:Pre-mRNA-splicing factor CWC24 n=1 Tax=Suillus subaureus TaxID=48587 RepID=A0A9P7DXU4_9AGAM|nr:uncharacterized protein BJ212DRAFT_1282996 [Suillus subaureus]KAG1806145.1 hypothetical protein BJ212DRAFT_1282996 [Suillus subaureus]